MFRKYTLNLRGIKLLVKSQRFYSSDAIKVVHKSIDKIRNIGISAHIDSGKTTVTERILFYGGKIDEMHEVKGKDRIGATMDSMELERQRGITIQSAATYINWKGNQINIIDTPGHIDFTIEVERALRVLDGAVLVLCGVGGVQAQTYTVTNQMKRYNIPCVAFINKLDRQRANHNRVISQIQSNLGYNAALIQVPIGLEDKLRGIVDLISRKALYFEGNSGDVIREDSIPKDMEKEVEEKRKRLIECVSNADDKLGEMYLEEKTPTDNDIREAIRRSCLNRKFVPVCVGSALKNKGVQPLLDSVVYYLPNPSEVENYALLEEGSESNKVQMNPERSDKHAFVGFAFKLENNKFGQLTYVRIYQGAIHRGDTVYNTRTGMKTKIGRLARIHSNEIEEISEAYAGDICAFFKVECATGDSLVVEKNLKLSMESIHVPEPVISMSLKVVENKQDKKNDKFSAAMKRFVREDPTFHCEWNTEHKEFIISGMGELHLEIYGQRLEREYNCPVILGQPKVSFRETLLQPYEFNYLHKQQTGGSGQFGRVVGIIKPIPPKEDNTKIIFVDECSGAKIPKEFMKWVEKGFREMCEKGWKTGHKVAGIKIIVQDGAQHCVDSNNFAFMNAAKGAMEQAYQNGKWGLLEPIMKVDVTVPTQHMSQITAALSKKSGLISGNPVSTDEYITLTAEVPLNNMFDFSQELRQITSGSGEYTMEYQRYVAASQTLMEELQNIYQNELKEEEKMKN